MSAHPGVEFDWPRRLRILMRQHEVGPTKLARTSGVSVSMVRAILSGDRYGSTETHAAICEALEEDPGVVFPRTQREEIRAEMFRLTPLATSLGTSRKRPGLEVVHSFVGECQEVAGL